MSDFTFDTSARDGMARAGTIQTPHGTMHTPTFTVVGTYGQVRFVPPEVLHQIGTQAMLCNGYHLFREASRLEAAGGLAAAFGWNGPTVTDSGGFQVMSLGSGLGKVVSMEHDDVGRRPTTNPENRLAQVTDDGVSFRNPVDGKLEVFTPEISISAQYQIGADITMAFDELTSIGDSYEYNQIALERTEKWADRSLRANRELNAEYPDRPFQAIYGVLQGAHYRDLRESTAKTFSEMDFDGYGLGGAFEKRQLGDILNWTNSILPEYKPRHLLGLSRPDDIFVGVAHGIDTFDCVAPTREARHGRLYTQTGNIDVMRARFADNPEHIDPECDCPTCQIPRIEPRDTNGFISTGLIRRLLKSHNQAERRLGYSFTSVHNVRFILRLMEQIRANLISGTFNEFRKDWLTRYLGNYQIVSGLTEKLR
ncbi:MAG: tRNA guanosine(34) transglycosylase Tgt [Promicromonosporaceae bacterium]|nr:tRNA guanosine(34) transglycosylase Tgt [Promicromonosporaceae bacterium]